MDIVELGHSAPHDHITRRRVGGAVEITAESSDLEQVSGDGCFSKDRSRLGFHQFIQQVNFGRVQGDGRRQVRFGSLQHGQPEELADQYQRGDRRKKKKEEIEDLHAAHGELADERRA